MSNHENQDVINEALGLLRGGNSSAAESLLAGIVDQDPDNFDALRLRGIACHLQEKHEDAVGFLKEALSVDPGSAQTHYNLGVAL